MDNVLVIAQMHQQNDKTQVGTHVVQSVPFVFPQVQPVEQTGSPASIEILHAVAKMITKGGQQSECTQYAFKDQVPFAQHVSSKQKRDGQQICESGDDDPDNFVGVGPAAVIAGRASTIGRRAHHEQFMALKISVATGIACGAHVGRIEHACPVQTEHRAFGGGVD